MFHRLASLRTGKRLPAYSAIVLLGLFMVTGAPTRFADAAATLSPLATFGGGDGWLSPGEFDYPYLTNGNTERGLAYGNGHLYLVSRANPTLENGNNIRILDPSIGVDGGGSDLGGLDSTGIAGGFFGVNMVGVSGDGAIYVGNLQTATNVSGGAFYKVYKWTNESSVPTVAYSGDAGLSGVRVGDDFAVIGSGASTRIAAGYSNNPTVLGNNGYAIINPTAGTASAVSFASTPPNAGDFRLGITFTDANHVIGTQQPAGITNGFYRYTSFSGGSGTLIASPDLLHSGGATAERQMAYDVINGTPLLAMQSTGDSHVAIYSLADPANPVFLVSGNNTLAPFTNPNATGSVAWGPTINNGDGSFSATLYAMGSNQGIQAFTFTLSPSTTTPVAGDYNGNGVVDAADYVLWRDTLNQPVTTGTGADGDGDGVVTQADYGFWRARFGNTAGSGSLASANVPEPTSLGVGCVACFMISILRRRRFTK